MRGCYVKAQIDPQQYSLRLSLEPLGLTATESLVSVDQQGHMFIPVHNYQGVCVKLREGTQLGAVRRCEMPEAL